MHWDESIEPSVHWMFGIFHTLYHAYSHLRDFLFSLPSGTQGILRSLPYLSIFGAVFLRFLRASRGRLTFASYSFEINEERYEYARSVSRSPQTDSDSSPSSSLHWNECSGGDFDDMHEHPLRYGARSCELARPHARRVEPLAHSLRCLSRARTHARHLASHIGVGSGLCRSCSPISFFVRKCRAWC